MANSPTHIYTPQTHKNSNNIKIGQLNIQHNITATHTIINIAHHHNIDILLLQEPYTYNNKSRIFPLHYRIAENTQTTPNTSIVIINSNITIQELPEYTTQNITITRLTTNNKHIYLISAYIPNTLNIDLFIDNLHHTLTNLNTKNIIICIDTNSHNTQWGDYFTDKRGKTLYNYITTQNLNIIHSQHKPTFTNKNGTSHIDITITDYNTANNITDWTVQDTYTASDHKLITFTINTNTNNTYSNTNNKITYNTQKFENWDTLLNEILIKFTKNDINEHTINNITDSTQINTMTVNITDIITEICNKHLSSKHKHRHSPQPWWDNTLTLLKRHINKLKRKLSNTRTDTESQLIKTEIQRNKKTYKHTIYTNKNNHWKNICTQIDPKNPFKTLYKHCKNNFTRIQFTPTLKDYNNTIIPNIQQECTHLAQHFYHSTLQTQTTTIPQNNTTPDDTHNITITEIRHTTQTQLKHTAPGNDNIDKTILTHLLQHFPYIFTSLFNTLYKLQTFPNIWKHTKTIIIQKPNKQHYDTATSYRPITLICTLSKIYEKLITNRLTHYLYTHQILSPHQHGYTKNKSTLTATKTITNIIHNTFKNKTISSAIFLDITGAFDNTQHHKILERLIHTKTPNNITHIIQSYLTNRSTTIHWQNHTTDILQHKGCPQGSILGPFLWLLIIDPILHLLIPRNTHITAYADDIAIIITDTNTDTITTTGNTILNHINNWALENTLQFSNNKCTSITFTNKIKFTTPTFTLNNFTLKNTDNIKYLGLHIDNKLNFNKHLDITINKINNFTTQFKRISKNTYGCSRNTINIIYKQVILPILTYNCSIFTHNLNKKLTIKKLNTIQRTIGILTTKAYYDISHHTATSLTGHLPITIEIKKIAHIQDMLNSPTFTDNNITYDIETKTPKHKLLHPTQLIDNITITEEQEHTNITINTSHYKNKNTVGGAYNIHYINNNVHYQRLTKLHKHCSPTQAHEQALLHSLNILKDEDTKDKNININIHNTTLYQRILNNKSTHYITYKIIKKILALQYNNNIHIQYNSTHDNTFVKQVITNKTKATYNKLEPTFYKTLLNNLAKTEHNTWYTNINTSKIKQYFPTLQDIQTFLKYYTLNFYSTQIITEHGKFNTYLHKRHIKPSPHCTCDDTIEQTPAHLILHCTEHTTERQTLTNTLQLHNITPTLKNIIQSEHIQLLIDTFTNIHKKISSAEHYINLQQLH